MNNQAIAAAAKSLVIRAREGDQNAMAMIAQVRDNAKAGHGRARLSRAAIEQYIRANPVPGDPGESDTDIGAEATEALVTLQEVGPILGLPLLLDLPKSGDDALFAASIILANGKTVLADRINEIAQGIADRNDQDMFRYAVENSHKGIGDQTFALPVFTKKVFYAGLCIGLAQNIQQVRTPQGVIAKFAPMAAWELGELPEGMR